MYVMLGVDREGIFSSSKWTTAKRYSSPWTHCTVATNFNNYTIVVSSHTSRTYLQYYHRTLALTSFSKVIEVYSFMFKVIKNGI